MQVAEGGAGQVHLSGPGVTERRGSGMVNLEWKAWGSWRVSSAQSSLCDKTVRMWRLPLSVMLCPEPSVHLSQLGGTPDILFLLEVIDCLDKVFCFGWAGDTRLPSLLLGLGPPAFPRQCSPRLARGHVARRWRT